jgi:hypothetical protein
MLRNCSFILILFLIACTPKPRAPYEYVVRELGEGEFEIAMEGRSGIPLDTLKSEFKKKGTELCGREKVYLLRGMREDDHLKRPNDAVPDRYSLRGQVDCVGMDYFSSN